MPDEKHAEKEQQRTPPVVAWRTFINFIRSLGQALPSRIDRSVMRSYSGAGQTQILHALLSLGLTDENGVPTEALKLLVGATEGEIRQKILQEILEDAYPFLKSKHFSLKNATHDQLAEEFKKLASGDTVRKCITFFIPAAKEANFDMSPFIRDIGKRSGNNKPRKVRTDQKTPKHGADTIERQLPPQPQNLQEMLLAKFPNFDPSWSDEVKAKWMDSFADLMKRTAGDKK